MQNLQSLSNPPQNAPSLTNLSFLPLSPLPQLTIILKSPHFLFEVAWYQRRDRQAAD